MKHGKLGVDFSTYYDYWIDTKEKIKNIPTGSQFSFYGSGATDSRLSSPQCLSHRTNLIELYQAICPVPWRKFNPRKMANQDSRSLLKLLAPHGKTGLGEPNGQALMGYSIWDSRAKRSGVVWIKRSSVWDDIWNGGNVKKKTIRK